MTRKISFTALCEEEKQKPTKLEDLYARAARVTRKAVTTVKMWAIGRQMPDDLTIEILAKEFQCDFDYWKIQCKLPPKTKRFCPLVLK